MTFRLISDNGGWLGGATVRLITSEFPRPAGITGLNMPNYETCVFYADGENDVLSRYTTRAAAMSGHGIYTRQFHLNYKKLVPA